MTSEVVENTGKSSFGEAQDKLVDESFIWTYHDGRQASKRQLLDKLGSG